MYQRIRDARQDLDYSQKKVAEILSVAQTTYSDYELGKLNIPLETLKKLAVLYQTSIDYLLELTDERKPYKRKENERLLV